MIAGTFVANDAPKSFTKISASHCGTMIAFSFCEIVNCDLRRYDDANAAHDRQPKFFNSLLRCRKCERRYKINNSAEANARTELICNPCTNRNTEPVAVRNSINCRIEKSGVEEYIQILRRIPYRLPL